MRVIAHEMRIMINQVKKEVRKVGKDSTAVLSKKVAVTKRVSQNSGKVDKLGILHEAKDWVMEVDVDQQLRFVEAVCISTQRPDIITYSLNF